MNLRPYALGVFVASLTLVAPVARAQTADNPSGHWRGVLQLPSGPVIDFDVDIAKNAGGGFDGSVDLPADNIKGLPLNVSVDGRTVSFHARADQPFRGTLTADGQTIEGEFSMPMGAAPMRLTRAGEPNVARPPSSPAIGKDLEGTWNGSLSANGLTKSVQLTLTNRPDGTATGRLINTEEGGLQIPVTIKQSGSAVTLETTVLAGGFSGTLNGTTLTGTWTERGMARAMTFQRAEPSTRRQ